MANVVVKENHLTFGGKKYFRGGAEDVTLGAYGDKSTPLFGQNYLEVKNRIPGGLFHIEKATIAEIDFARSDKGGFAANVKVAGVARGGTKVGYNMLHAGELKLVKLTVLPQEMMDAANNAPKHLANLDRYGKGARIAHQIFVVLEAREAREFTRNSAFEVSVKKGVLKITAKASRSVSGEVVVTVEPGATFAYLLLRPKWRKGKIRDVVDDQWGLG